MALDVGIELIAGSLLTHNLFYLIYISYFENLCQPSHFIKNTTILFHRSQIWDIEKFNFHLMNWQNLYQEQLYENLELKKQLEIVESILRNFLPIIENNDDQEN